MAGKKPSQSLKDNQNNLLRIASLAVVTSLIIAIGLWLNQNSQTESQPTNQASQALPANIQASLLEGFSTDFSNSSLDDFEPVIDGGPSKDGTPAISDPKFEPISETSIAGTTRGVLVDLNGEARFYPYNILVWHEIVNDTIGEAPIAITFCPLCGSAIVYDRTVDGNVLDFGVSGFLRESNMIMYDRATESLWQQATGEAFAGDFNGKILELVHFQLLELFMVKEAFPNATVMTTDTGFTRDYEVYPYGNYDNDESLFFDVSVDDRRFPAKELFYVVNNNERSVALRVGELPDGERTVFSKAGIELVASKNDGLITIHSTEADNPLAGYYEMWFSWSTWHQEDGLVWEP